MPLIGDIKSAGKALERMKSQQPSIRVHGFGTYTNSESTNSSQKAFATGLEVIETIRRKDETQVKLTGNTRLSIPDYSFSSQSGLTFREFVPSLWELLPYSFVADYFGNIGDILNAISYSDIKLTYCCRTDRYVGTAELSTQRVKPNIGGLTDYGGEYSWNTKKVTIQRSKFEPAVPSLQLQLPNFKQGINLAALFATGRSISKLLSS